MGDIRTIAEAYTRMRMAKDRGQPTQEMLPPKVYVDDNRSRWATDVSAADLREMKLDPNDVIAVGQVKVKGRSIDMTILRLNDFDRKFVSGVRLQPGEFIARYVTRTTIAGQLTPFVKVSLLRNAIYPMTEESASGESNKVDFERRGQKMDFLRVHKDFIINEIGFE